MSDVSNFKQGQQLIASYTSKDILPFFRTGATSKNNQARCVHLQIDATYFAQFCLVCYQDNFDGYTRLLRFTDGEHYEEIKEDLVNLIKIGIQIESITTDGHKSILKAIKRSVPGAMSNSVWFIFSVCA